MKRLSKAISALLFGAIIVSNSSAALAVSKNKISKSKHKHYGIVTQTNEDKFKKHIESDFKSLVSAGIITQDESAKIIALIDENREKRSDIFSKAVEKGIITQEKADAAKAKLREIHKAKREAVLNEKLKGLVDAGTINREQADKITAYINSLAGNGHLKESRNDMKNPLSELVNNGTLTQAQLDAVIKALSTHNSHEH